MISRIEFYFEGRLHAAYSWYVSTRVLDKIDFLHNVANKEEFEGNTERSTAAYSNVREDASTGLTYKLPLEASYARSLMKEQFLKAKEYMYGR